jgi:hypothetical protein
LDRLGWAAGLSIVSHGVRIGIRVNDPGVLQRVADHLPPGWKPSGSPLVTELCSLLVGGSNPGSRIRRYHLLYWGSGRIARTLDDAELFVALESLLDLVVAVRAPRRIFVRAAVVGWQGKGVVICGPPSSGKTTLVEALLRAGATYYSDQYAVLDARGSVHPYPKPLTVRGEADASLKRYPGETLPGRVGTKSLPVRLVLLTRYQPGTRWRPGILSPGQAVLGLLAHTVPARLRPKVALATLRRIAASATTLRGKRGEAEDIVVRLLNYLGSPDLNGRVLTSSPARVWNSSAYHFLETPAPGRRERRSDETHGT